MNFKITIILPIFNVEKYVEKALNSIVNQTIRLKYLEVIMIDDCSTDDSGKIIDEYARKYDNFKAIHLPTNSGAPGEPKNIGINESSSEYIMFLDPDDFYEEDACETLYNKIIEEDADFVSGVYKLNNNGKNSIISSENVFKGENEIKINNFDERPDLLFTGPVMLSKIFKKSFITENNISFPHHIPAEDNVFFINALFKANKIVYLKKPIFTYFKRKNSMTNDLSVKSLINFLKAQKMVFEIFKKNDKEKYYDLYYATKIDHYLNYIFLIEKIEIEDIKYIYNEIEWFFKLSIYFNIFPKKDFNKLLFDLLMKKEFKDILLLKKIFNTQKYNDEEFEKEIGILKSSEISSKKELTKLKTVNGWLKYKLNNIYDKFRK